MNDTFQSIRLLLPRSDGKQLCSIGFTRTADAVIENNGLYMSSAAEALLLARWLVKNGFVHSAWVNADITGPIRKQDLE